MRRNYIAGACRIVLLSCTFLLCAHSAYSQSFLACQPYGGAGEVKAFLDQEMRFPKHALDDGVKGTTVLIFTILRDGTMRDLRVWRPLDPACDAEALRLGSMVRWHPGEMGGLAVDAEHFLNVPFDPKKYRKNQAKAVCPPGKQDTLPSLTIHSAKAVDEAARPLLPEGIRSFNGFLVGNMKYPTDAYRRDIEGKVELEFVVEPSGNVSNLWAKKELGGGCDQEAMRLVRRLCWQPARIAGSPVRSEQTLEIEFRLPSE